MEFCSLDDAFPAAGGTPSVGCGGAEATAKALKAEKKKAKHCKAPRLQFVESDLDEAAAGGAAPAPDADPDRPAQGYRTDPPKPFRITGMRPGADVQREGFSNGGGGIQPVIEGTTQANGTTAAPIPHWFGQQVGEEPFTPYTGTGSEDEHANSKEYMLQPSFEKSFSGLAGVDKATGGPVLPLPSLSDRWKPMTPGGQTAFFERLPTAAAVGEGASPASADVTEIKTKLDRIFSRLDELDGRRTCTDNSNTEVGMFVISGIFVMFFMDLLVRKTSTSLRLFST